MPTSISKPSLARRYDHGFFEKLYTEHDDPWAVLTSDYEQDKFDATLGALQRDTYSNALELGCSIGALTRRLAPRCKALTAVDTSPAALRRARLHCPDAHVSFVQAHLPDGDWHGPYDLVVLSEVLYYFPVPALVRLADRLSHVVTRHTEVISVHWTGDTDYPLSGDRATELFQSLLRAQVRQRVRHPSYRLETWSMEQAALPDYMDASMASEETSVAA